MDHNMRFKQTWAQDNYNWDPQLSKEEKMGRTPSMNYTGLPTMSHTPSYMPSRTADERILSQSVNLPGTRNFQFDPLASSIAT